MVNPPKILLDRPYIPCLRSRVNEVRNRDREERIIRGRSDNLKVSVFRDPRRPPNVRVKIVTYAHTQPLVVEGRDPSGASRKEEFGKYLALKIRVSRESGLINIRQPCLASKAKLKD